MDRTPFLSPSRATASIVAGLAWLGLGAQLWASTEAMGHVGWALVAMSRYFTVLTNGAAAVTFTLIAAGRRLPSAWLGGVSLCIALVGVVYHLLLQGFLVLPGFGVAANLLMHTLVPLAVTLYWAAFSPRGDLRWADPWRWVSVVAIYFLYALGRGALDGETVYPFMNVVRLGWPRVLETNLAIGAVFVLVAHGVVALDKRIGQSARRRRT